MAELKAIGKSAENGQNVEKPSGDGLKPGGVAASSVNSTNKVKYFECLDIAFFKWFYILDYKVCIEYDIGTRFKHMRSNKASEVTCQEVDFWKLVSCKYI